MRRPTVSVPSVHSDKMAVNVVFRQRAVIEILVKNNSAAGLYGGLHRVCGDACIRASSVTGRVKLTLEVHC